MRKSTRALVGMIVLDFLLVAGAAFLVVQARSGASPNPSEAIATITTIFGGAIGAISGILAFAYVFHRRRGQ